MESAVIERIKQIIESKGLSARAFANKIDFKYSTLNNYLTGRRSSIDLDLIIKIESTFDDISIPWLITGKGGEPEVQTLSNDDYSLYYYTTAETLLKILGDDSEIRIKDADSRIRIKYSDFNKANDPKERAMYEHFEKNKKAELSKYKFISFCKQPKFKYYTNKAVTFPRMWAQYGTTQNKDSKDNKSYMNGACIELNINKILKKSEFNVRNKNKKNKNGIEGLSFFDVDYKKDSEWYRLYHKEEIGFDEDVKFKWDSWKEESEFRALYTGTNDHLDITECIERIYLGADFRHEDVIKLCKIISQRRDKNIDPIFFTRIVVSTGGKLENSEGYGGGIESDMLGCIEYISESYYKKLIKKYEYDPSPTYRKEFYDNLEKEKRIDEERLKIEADAWKDKYYASLEELNASLKDNKELNLRLEEAIRETISLKDKLGEKKELVEEGAAAMDAQKERRVS
jgi:transcriptional regulator with XRE-family HTH domain